MNSQQYSLLKEKINSREFSSIFILVDENTDKYCLEKFLNKTGISLYTKLLIKSGEENKNLETCYYLWGELSSFKADRKSLLINLGGGVLTDLGGFVASTYLRGIKFYNVPTTLLGMVDAAHGGKTGVDFNNLKNQIGVFKDPEEVILDSEFLLTLNKKEYLNGFAEIFKHSLITDNRNLNFNSLLKYDFYDDIDFIITKYSQIKNNIVESDRLESNIRKTLNLGHTIGHAIESYSHFSNNIDQLKHGEAIIIGLISELYLSSKILGYPIDEVDNFKNTCNIYFEKKYIKEEDYEIIYDLMSYDKKNTQNKINFVLLDIDGNPVIDQKVNMKEFCNSLDYYNS